jgi:hypothetical protein
MREEQRRLAMTAWRDIFALAGSQMDAEFKYFELLRRADAMERNGLITSVEWRKLAQQAGTLLASTAECMADRGRPEGIARRWAELTSRADE